MDERLLKQIRDEALDLAESRRQRLETHHATGHTLDALEEVTGLPRADLERVAGKVWHSHELARDRFFCLKQQLLWAALSIAPLALLAGWLIFAFY